MVQKRAFSYLLIPKWKISLVLKSYVSHEIGVYCVPLDHRKIPIRFQYYYLDLCQLTDPFFPNFAVELLLADIGCLHVIPQILSIFHQQQRSVIYQTLKCIVPMPENAGQLSP